MSPKKSSETKHDHDIRDGVSASGEGTITVRKDSIYVGGAVGGDVLGAGAQKITITDEQAYQVHGLSNPYLGLRSFKYDDRAAFAGRTTAIRQAVEQLTNPADPVNLLFVTGASGSGKSSFVQAGLVPALESYYVQRHKQVRYAVFRPSIAPLAMLADAQDQLGLPPVTVDQLASLTTIEFNSFLADNTVQNQVNLLVIDQFEECFTQSAHEQRDRLFTLLVGLAPFSAARTHVIVTLRSDYLDELFNHAALWQVAKQGIELRAMVTNELKDAIQQPLHAAGELDERYQQKRFEPALLERLAADTAQDPAYLPLLQVTLEELWTGGSLVLERYGQLSDAIRQRAEAVYGFEDYDSSRPAIARSQDDQDEILKIFTDLVEVSMDDDPRRDVRRRRTKAELVGDSIQCNRLVDSLVTARLLSATTESRIDIKLDVVDIIHESLIAKWSRLQDAVAAKRQNLQRRVRFEQALAEWQTDRQIDDYLLVGIHLAEGRELERFGDISLRNPEAQQFLKASQAKAESAQRRRTRFTWAVVVGLSILALIAIVAAVYAGRQNQQLAIEVATSTARLESAINAGGTAEAQKSTSEVLGTAEAYSRLSAEVEKLAAETAEAIAIAEQLSSRSRELAAIAIEQIDSDPELAVLLSLEALRNAETNQAGDALRRSLTADYLRVVLRGHRSGVNVAAFSPDGKKIVTASDDGTAILWDAQKGVELAVLRGHVIKVTSASFSPDGKKVVTASWDGTARIWDSQRGTELVVMRGHDGALNSAVFSPDGKFVVTASYDSTARLWDTRTGAELAVLRGHKNVVSSAVFSPDGEKVVTASWDQTARIWDVASGTGLKELSGHTESVNSAVFSPDGLLIVTASDDDTARVWEAWGDNIGVEVAVLVGHSNGLTGAVFSPDGMLVVSTSKDGTGRLWGVWGSGRGKELAVLRGHAGQVVGAAFSPDSKIVVTFGLNDTARIWDTVTGIELVVLRGHVGSVFDSEFSPDGRSVVTAGSDSTAKLWDIVSGSELAVLRGHNFAIPSAAFSPDEKKIVTASRDGSALLWDAENGVLLKELTGHKGTINNVDFSPDGKIVVTASDDGTARIWNAESGAVLKVLSGHESLVVCTVFSPDGLTVATGSWDKTARLWDTKSGTELKVLPVSEWVTGVAFSPDAKMLLTISSDQARLWDVDSGKELAAFSGKAGIINSADFSPDGKMVVTASSEGTAQVWDTISGAELAALRGHRSSVTSASFSLNGEMVVTTSEDGTARLWDSKSGVELAVLSGHTGTVLAAAFSPDGKMVVTASGDHTARLWDVNSGAVLAVLQGHTGPVTRVTFSPDGKKVLTAGEDGTVRMYPVFSDDLNALAKQRVTREFTCVERVLYLSEELICPTATINP